MQARYKAVRDAYTLDPKRCRLCKFAIPFDKRRNDFCSRSCAAIVNNGGVVRNGKPRLPCPNCRGDIGENRKYCSHSCQFEFSHKEYIQKWIAGEISGNGKADISDHIRQYLIETFGHQCAICRRTEWEGRTIPLLLDHIDGNAQDSGPKNVRLICGNCNMQLPTFAGRNRGKGREDRRARYKPVSVP